MKDEPMHQADTKKSLSLWASIKKASFCVLAGCFFLLSACSGTATQNTTHANVNNSPTPIVTPTISIAQQNEGNAELQTFQQWIALMQQYHGDVTTYQQQYSSDQQALQGATSSSAYTHALHTLQGHVVAFRIPGIKPRLWTYSKNCNRKRTVLGNNIPITIRMIIRRTHSATSTGQLALPALYGCRAK